MTPERWGEVKAVLQSALGTEPSERAAYVARTCGADAALRREVESLLAADRTDSFLEVPATVALGNAGWDAERGTGEVSRGAAGDAELRARLTAALGGRYVVERELGRGGMATVYLARDLRHRRPVALKVVRPELATAVGAGPFLREIETTARLAHPHILPLLDSGEAGGVLYYAMPYVEGESLRDWLRREKQLPVAEALRVTREVADALDYAHRQGVVHRDVKPENVLLEDGHAVVADFGIARAIATAGGERLAETLAATGAVGTPAYMSPEQSAGGREVDGRSDVYALGCVLYELLAGGPPFTGPTAESVARQHLTTPAPPVTDICPDVPPGIAATVARALEKDPANRFATAAQFADALRLPAETGGMGAATPAAPRVSRSVGTRRRVAIGALAITAIAAALGTWTAHTRLRDTAPRAPAPPARRAYTVVAGVDGTADAEDRGAARNLLLTALDQSGIVVSLPDEQMRLGLASAGKPDSLPVDVGTATELAVRGGLRTVIAPRVDRVGGTYHVSVRVLDADSGTALVTERAIARGADDLIPAIDGVIAAVRRRLGEQPEALAASRPLEWAATPSFAAIRALQRAAKVTHRRDAHADVPLIREALALDPDFAFAWLRLGVALANAGFPDSAAWAWNEALARPSRLTEAQRLRVIGYLAMHRRDFASAVEVWARDVRMFGADPNNLSLTLDRLDRGAEGVALMEEWARTTPFGISLGNRANHAVLLARLGRSAEARRKAAGLPTDVRAELAEIEGAWEEAESLATSVLDTLTARPRVRDGMLLVLASTAAAQGRAGKARTYLRERRDAALRQQNYESARSTSYQLLALSLASGVRPARADARALRVDTTRDGRATEALLAATLGYTRKASAMLSVAAGDSASTLSEGGRALLGATVAHSRGDAEAVTRLIGPIAPGARRTVNPGSVLAYWMLADAYERRDRLDSAAIWFGALLDITRLANDDFFGSGWGYTHSFAHWRLARIHTAQGDTARTREHAAAFLRAFRRPDPELSWMVEEARRYASTR